MSGRSWVGLCVLVGCGGSQGGPGRSPETDPPPLEDCGTGTLGDLETGGPSTTGSSSTADTGSVGSTTDSGGSTGDTGGRELPGTWLLTPGCPLPYSPVPADLALCEAQTVFQGGLYQSWLSDTFRAYDAAGREVYYFFWDGYAVVELAWTFDPVTGDLLQETENQDFGDYLTVRSYTYTRDAQGRVIEVEETTTMSGSYFPGAQWSTLTTFTWGPCGVVEERGPGARVSTTEYFLEGTRKWSDVDGDGAPESFYERWVDPLSGVPFSAFQQYDLDPYPYYWLTHVRDPVTGWVLEESGYEGDFDVESTWTYDPEGRVLHLREVKRGVEYGSPFSLVFDTDTTWTCPP